ncbi:HNH endonuclease [Mangrovibacter sp. MFB070]|nr:HNH endonuclease [Mangrovibacter sp. MFB070]
MDDIYLDDIPNIRHPAAAVRDMEYTANSNSIIQEWNLPVGYGAFVNKYRVFHRQFTWMAYRDVLNDLRNGKIVLLRNNHSGSEIFPVITQSGQLRNDLPASMYFRLSYITDNQLKRPVHYRTINSKAAGRLLAAGGLYNGNIEGFRRTAEQLGGDAAKGYDQVLNQTTSGLLISAASLLVVRNPMAAEELTSYLGKYKQAHVLLDDMNVQQINYLRRDRGEYALLRNQFNSSVRPNFLKSLSEHPDALSTFDAGSLERLAGGKTPAGWQVHHKIPLDDGGTNDFDNLVLIQNSPYHSALTKTQAIITKDLPYNSGTDVLWPSPNGVIYPVGK